MTKTLQLLMGGLLGAALVLTAAGCNDDGGGLQEEGAGTNEVLTYLYEPPGMDYLQVWGMQTDGTDKLMLASSPDGEVVQQAVSPDGHTLLYVLHQPVGQLVSMDLDTGIETVLIDNEDSDWDPVPSFSPDGTKIVYSMVHSYGEQYGLRIMDSDGGNIVVLTDDDGVEDTTPAYNAAGNKIVFDRGRNGSICVINPDGTGLDEIKAQTEDYSYGHPQFLPDGRIICMRDGPNGKDIVIMDADGDNEINLTPDSDGTDEFSPTVNSDGTRFSIGWWPPKVERIAFATDRNGEYDVYIADLSGSMLTNLINLTEDVDYSCWRPRFGNIDEQYMTPPPLEE